jgi:hypothetical protein
MYGGGMALFAASLSPAGLNRWTMRTLYLFFGGRQRRWTLRPSFALQYLFGSCSVASATTGGIILLLLLLLPVIASSEEKHGLSITPVIPLLCLFRPLLFF